MSLPSSRMDDAQFRRVAQTCRWSDRSLAVVRALLVDDAPLPTTAATYQMSEKQARIIRARFLEKAEKLRLAEFMSQERPKAPRQSSSSMLEAYASDIRKLRNKHYTVKQIVAYLQKNGVTTSATTVGKFLRSLSAL